MPAVLRGTRDRGLQLEDQGPTPQEATGKYVVVWEKVGRDWKLARRHGFAGRQRRETERDHRSTPFRRRRCDVLADAIEHQGLDLGRRHPHDTAGFAPPALQHRLRHIITVANAALAGMARAHAVAAVVEEAAGQEAGRPRVRVVRATALAARVA